MENPLAVEVRAERKKEMRQASSATSQVLPGHLRLNKLNVRLLLGGGGCTLLGLWWLVDGASGGPMDAVIGGLLWKGPLLSLAGAGAVYYGYRMMTDSGPRDSASGETGTSQATEREKTEGKRAL